MKDIFVIDISGKVIGYDYALCGELCKVAPVTIVAHKQGNETYGGKCLPLIRLIPARYKNSEHIVKRFFKALESLLNYIWLLSIIIVKRPTILHFQWFPFMEFCSVDNHYVSLIKKIRHKQKIILTVHNVYPHDMSDRRKKQYRNRFIKSDRYIDNYIVHVESSKEELMNEFGIPSEKITVIPHGIFTPDYVPSKRKEHKGQHIIMYGNNTPYKGTDLLLNALQELPEDVKRGLNVTIAGRVSETYHKELQNKAHGLSVNIIPEFIPDQQLYEMIDEADFIALPYRNISQSGVLLLALYFRKPLLISDLPSFKETLKGFSEDMFFEADNVPSLAQLIERHLRGEIDTERQMEIIDGLVELYSWEKSAEKTKALYDEILK